MALSGRGHDRVLRVARTIADLEGRDHVLDRDLDEALSYRLDDMGAGRGVILDACDPCLRRAFLIAHLAPRIAGLLGSGDRRARGLLALGEDDLIAAAAGRQVERALSFLERLDTGAERERLAEGGFLAVCLHSPRYPAHLHDLADPPAVLFGVGRADALASLTEEPAVTVVGTRRASPYGTEVAYAWAGDSAHPG